MNDEERRYVEIRIGGKWVRQAYSSVKQGDVIQVYEPDGTFVLRGKAAEDAHIFEGESTIYLADGSKREEEDVGHIPLIKSSIQEVKDVG